MSGYIGKVIVSTVLHHELERTTDQTRQELQKVRTMLFKCKYLHMCIAKVITIPDRSFPVLRDQRARYQEIKEQGKN